MQITSSDTPTTGTLYELLGGETGLRRLVDAFYDRMDREASCAGIRGLHPDSLSGSRDKFFWFLCGWSGGPDLYLQRFGHPRLRARHLPYPIGESERDQWLSCMQGAMTEAEVPEPVRRRLTSSFFQTADWMRNQPG
ncbi:group II truncated hemoglobin [Hydrocarboniphaga sp.]|uniref:group II truncated hemoglobin n=1 Tax=Hydrocarboniphaga sp. TaxID=2033016 RepID=UPI00260ABC80|nr:group II truncated hemoglobin [Hydrocarboniphaga sp.]